MKNYWAKVFYGVVFLLIVIGYLWSESWLGSDYILFTNIIYQLPLLMALITAVGLIRLYGFKTPHGKSFSLITAGLGCWLAAEMLWIIYESVLQVETIYPSPASFLYLASYVFLFLGFTNEWKIGGSKFPKWLMLILCPVVVLMMGLMSYAVYDNTATNLANLVSLAYSVADVLVLVSAIFALFNARQYDGGRLYYPWLWIFIGIVATLVGDILALVFIDAYEAEVFLARQIDLFWVLTFVSFGYAFTSINTIITDVRDRLNPPTNI